MNADVIIIGGGVIGCASAYYLKKAHPETSILVLEREVIGHGGSSRNGGGVRQSARDVRELPLAMYAIENMWPTLSEELDMDVEYYKKGNLRLGKTEAHLKTLQALVDKSTAAGLDVRMISGDEAREICPYMSHEVIGASWCPTDGHATPRRTTLAFYRAARRLGVHFITGIEVTGLKKIRGHIRQVITSDGIYEAETVVLCAGYESRTLAHTVELDIPMFKHMEECLVTEMEPPMFWQMLGTAEADFYGHQTQHGSFAFGGHSGMENYQEPTYDTASKPLTASAICRGIMKYFPALEHAKIVRSWAGWADYCVDGVPVIDTVSEVPGLVLACAFTGHGFGICPAVGLTVSELVQGIPTTVPIDHLKYDRFKAKG